jgi:organic hydroperoxide reductase OsmC/OhrA
MSQYLATIEWRREGQDFLDRRYSRAHQWVFDGGARVAASASPHIVPLPLSVASNVDPEEAFVAALSSCHMLFFLDFASRSGVLVDSYQDQALGWLETDGKGHMAMTRVELRPRCQFGGPAPTPDELRRLHALSHENCFIANSVTCSVSVKPLLD